MVFHKDMSSSENFCQYTKIVVTMRSYARTIYTYAIVVCPSVYPSVTSRYCIGTTTARRLFSTYPTLCYKEIRVPLKIWVLASGTLPKTLNLEDFAMASQ